ncbi:MAG: DUF2267 domain-containing protein [Spirochaetes bacterium]|nr:DUF2267 domain-containing protein [Spirochaetota bacterium]
MPYPSEYQRASDHFAKFLMDAKEEAGFGSAHQAYTMVQGVFQAFRRRLDIRDSIIFTSVMNVGMRALYIADWNPDEKRVPFGSLEDMNRDVKTLRPLHNFSPDNAIAYVARALRKNVDEERFDAILALLPPEAREFWMVR